MTREEIIENVSLKDTSELQKYILENPEVPLMFFVNSEILGRAYNWVAASVFNITVAQVTMTEEYWVQGSDFVTDVIEDIYYEYEKHLNPEELDALIDKKLDETVFVKAICVYLD